MKFLLFFTLLIPLITAQISILSNFKPSAIDKQIFLYPTTEQIHTVYRRNTNNLNILTYYTLNWNLQQITSKNLLINLSPQDVEQDFLVKGNNLLVVGNINDQLLGPTQNQTQDCFLLNWDIAQSQMNQTLVFGSQVNDSCYRLLNDGNNGLYVLGETGGSFDDGSLLNETNFFVRKYDLNFQLQWMTYFPKNISQLCGSSIDSTRQQIYLFSCTLNTVTIHKVSAQSGQSSVQSFSIKNSQYADYFSDSIYIANTTHLLRLNYQTLSTSYQTAFSLPTDFGSMNSIEFESDTDGISVFMNYLTQNGDLNFQIIRFDQQLKSLVSFNLGGTGNDALTAITYLNDVLVFGGWTDGPLFGTTGNFRDFVAIANITDTLAQNAAPSSGQNSGQSAAPAPVSATLTTTSTSSKASTTTQKPPSTQTKSAQSTKSFDLSQFIPVSGTAFLAICCGLIVLIVFLINSFFNRISKKHFRKKMEDMVGPYSNQL